MTRKKDFKTKVRARMAKTGERYSAARAKMIGSAAEPAAGAHDDTAAMRALLEAAGITDPITGEPLTEAMLLGLGGGLGAAYYVFEYAGHPPSLYIETRVGPQAPYDAGFFERIASGLGIDLDIAETGGAKKAAANLDAALERGPAMVWVDMASLPYRHLPAEYRGAMPHVLSVSEDGQVIERGRRFELDRASLEQARQRLRKGKNRVLSIAPQAIDRDALARGIAAGIERCLASLDGTAPVPGMPANLGIKALAKWARLANDGRDKKGWPRAFAPGAALFAGMRWGYHWIETAGTGGGAFRSMYAAFLDEAARVLDRPGLSAVADRYRELADRWSALARQLLPEAGPLAEARRLLDEIDRAGGGEAVAAARRRLDEIAGEVAADFPIDDPGELYAELAARLEVIASAETDARDALAAAI